MGKTSGMDALRNPAASPGRLDRREWWATLKRTVREFSNDNLTAVDTREDMGPFEIAPGTQFDDEPDFEHGMFPPKSRYGRYQERAVRKYPQRGDISARSALTIHRGTINHSQKARPVLVLGVDAPDATNGDKHDMAVTKGYWESLPEAVKRHLHCPVVDELTPITQKHTIEGLVMGDA